MNAELLIGFVQKNWLKLLVLAVLAYFVFIKNGSIGLKTEDWRKSAAEHSLFSEKTKQELAVKEELSILPLDFSAQTTLIQRLEGIDMTQKKAFLQRFVKVAKSEEKKYGIPNKLILAHALLQSAAGNAEASKMANNFFNMPCPNTEKGIACLQKYASAWESFRDHSEVLRQLWLNNPLPKNATSNDWANLIEQSHLWKEPNLAKQIMMIVESLE